MRRFFLLVLVATIFFGWKWTPRKTTIDCLKDDEYLPPGTVKIADNFYADKSEILNIHYKEYMFWVQRVFGINSLEYIVTIPDTAVWHYQSYYDSLHNTYFQTPEFNYHPVVGITLEQAKSFTRWRTDRVAELILIKTKLIEINREPTVDNFFTIESYLNGTYKGTIDVAPALLYPVYSIPTLEEWEHIAGIQSGFDYGIDRKSKHNKRVIKEYHTLYNTKERLKRQNEILKNDKKYQRPPAPTTNGLIGCQNVNELFNTIGNVSELIDEPGISIGGDWLHSLDGQQVNHPRQSNIPNCWTGFRNVCRFEVRNPTVQDK